MNLNFASMIIIILFSVGMITYSYSLVVKKARTPFYTYLAIGGAALAITATFAAIAAGWLGLLG